jgi:hypothetical protein
MLLLICRYMSRHHAFHLETITLSSYVNQYPRTIQRLFFLLFGTAQVNLYGIVIIAYTSRCKNKRGQLRHKLFVFSQFLHEELPVRLARRARELKKLPFGLGDTASIKGDHACSMIIRSYI